MKAILILAALLLPAYGFGQKEITEEKKVEPQGDETAITLNFNDDSDSELEYSSGAGRLFSNPAFASGLNNGSAAINRSIETLMEVLFYRLLDQSIDIKLTDEAVFKFGINREVYPTASGTNIIVDHFNLGPEYHKEIARYNSIPVSLGIDGKVGVFDIYLKSDGIRVAEQEDMPLWRVAINNVFGILPILTAILPPSFNPNELYDPGNVLATPFSFPLTIGGFRSMEIGTIRSYNISGGVNLPTDFAIKLPKAFRDRLHKADKLLASLPYSIFVEGEYRINVLRRSKNTAWVGLSQVKRLGNKISPSLGRSFEVLDKLILANWWKGVPGKFFPLDAQWAKAKASIFHQLYEFDLRRPDARKAYLQAVKGDFVLAAELHRKQSDLLANTGVTFHFTRHEDANETNRDTATNLVILSNGLQNARSESEIEVLDERGTFYLLRSRSDVVEEFTEVLTGRQKELFQNVVEMRVNKETLGDGQEKFVFDPKVDNPIQLIMSYRIQDRYTDAHEYRNYMRKLKFFTSLALKSAPTIPRRSNAKIEERKESLLLSDPTNNHLEVHVTPSYLGRFDATAAILFDTKQLDHILSADLDQMWLSFAKAWNMDEEFWSKEANRFGFKSLGAWLQYVAAQPFQLLNFRNDLADFVGEAHRAIAALREIRKVSTPAEKLSRFDRLFRTIYPDRLARALYLLSDRAGLPRSVSFSTSARGSADQNAKDLFRSLNNKVFRSAERFPSLERSRLADDKLAAFYPDELKERRLRPSLKRIDVRMVQLSPEELATLPELTESERQQKYIRVRVQGKNVSPASNGKIYIRIGESGRLQLGKFLVGERVFDVKPRLYAEQEKSGDLGTLTYQFYLTGPLSALSTRLQTFQVGGEYQVDLSLSNDGRVWSDEQNFRFVYTEDRLLPPN